VKREAQPFDAEDFASFWTWSKMTRRKRMQQGSISTADFLKNFFVHGSVDLWIETTAFLYDEQGMAMAHLRSTIMLVGVLLCACDDGHKRSTMKND
jgi:hypothetical protein